MRLAPLFAAWGLLTALAAETRADSDPYDLAGVYGAMNYDGVSTRVKWEDCGEVNAFYLPTDHTVHLCNELKAMPPSFIRVVLAHELAHGVIDQRDVPITGSEEAAADELAAYTLIAAGHAQDVGDTGEIFIKSAQPDDPFDVHPSDARRGVTLLCYAMQARGVDARLCPVSLVRMQRTWARLLHLGEFAP